jgi:ribosomal protein RSM22 (predicted rRNA methylase)
MELPQELRVAMEEEISPISTRLAPLAVKLSERYRTDKPSDGSSYFRTPDDISAYAAFRMPATFAAVHATLTQVKNVMPDLDPCSMLDIGAGPGTAMWATANMWAAINKITLIERDGDLDIMGRRLAAHSTLASIREALWFKADLTSDWELAPHDIVIASYSIGELPDVDRLKLIRRLWNVTAKVLVLIEPGTPAGFHRIRQARHELSALNAEMAAPCPHYHECPVTDGNWCHFAQRIQRSRLHRQLKSGELSYEDEKFSFVAVTRNKIPLASGSVLRHPLVKKGHIQLEMCTPHGVQIITVTRRDKEEYRVARDLSWGSAVFNR